MSDEIIKATKEEVNVDAQKRAFMKKFGKYAVVSAGMAVLMNPTSSSAGGSSTQVHTFKGRGWGVGGDTKTYGTKPGA